MKSSALNSKGAPAISLPIALVRDWGNARSFDDVIDVMSKWMPELIDSDAASLTLLTNDRTHFKRFALTGKAAIALGGLLPFNSMPGMAVQTDSVINLPSVSEHPENFETENLLQNGLHSALAAPLRTSSHSFGSLNVARTSVNAFDERDEMLVQGLAEVLGATLFATRRYETERDRSNTDALTGLANRRHILDLLEKQLAAGGSTVMFVDLDGFKLINDAYGHHTGDQLLTEIASRLMSECGHERRVGRIGGDEFLVLCNGSTSRKDALEFAQGLISVCSKPVVIDSIILQPRLSVGVAVPNSQRTTLAELLGQADQAMYKAKRTGVSLVEADEDVRHEAELIAAIDSDLDSALANDAIDFYYQPIRQLETNEILGCESLVRWFHPEVGLVPPPLLIARAELTRRIDNFTTWAIDRVCRDLAFLRSQHPRYSDKQLAFNLSPRQFGWSDYIDTHMAALDRHGLHPSDVLIEVVESGTIEVETTAESTIRALAERGVTISLDDFGTGHNVISYFSRFPIHGIKIDRSMTNAMATNPSVFKIVKGLTQIATDLNIEALGEGIETQAELDACLRAGIQVGQGYFLAKPMSLESLVELMHEEFPISSPEAKAA